MHCSSSFPFNSILLYHCLTMNKMRVLATYFKVKVNLKLSEFCMHVFIIGKTVFREVEPVSINSQKIIQPYVEKCLFCDQRKITGIHLYQSLICTECEHEMLNTKTSDTKYKFFIHKLKDAHYAMQRRQA